MNDWEWAKNNGEEQPVIGAEQSEVEGEVGLYDIVESFTALRQQWRTQAKENRDLAQSVQASAEKLANVDALLQEVILRVKQSLVSSSTASNSTTDGQLPLVRCIVEMDFIVRRAMHSLELVLRGSDAGPNKAGPNKVAANKTGANKNATERTVPDQEVPQASSKLVQQVDRILQGQPWWRRAFCRPFASALIKEMITALTGEETETKSAAEVEGMRLTLGRLERMLKEHGIERLDTLGLPFDGQLMLAIDAVGLDKSDNSDDPSDRDRDRDRERLQHRAAGIVVHEYSPAYRWNDKIVRIAEVRVAR